MKTIRRLTVVLTAILIIALAAVTASAADSRTAKTTAKKLTTVNATQAYQLLNNYRSQYNKQVKNSSQKIGTLKRDAELEKINTQTKAEQTKITAEAEAERIRITAEAQAKANKLISESLNELMLEYEKISKWNGVLPTTVSTGSGFMLEHMLK